VPSGLAHGTRPDKSPSSALRLAVLAVLGFGVVRVVVMFSYSAREPKLSNKLLIYTLSFETQIELMSGPGNMHPV
jgi:hypothetical protein